MKSKIHPEYHKINVKCSCGNTFEVGSTLKTSVTTEICHKCHPFWTGETKYVDIEGRVNQFKRKIDTAEKERIKRIALLKEKIAKEKERKEAPKSLKEMLKAMQ